MHTPYDPCLLRPCPSWRLPFRGGLALVKQQTCPISSGINRNSDRAGLISNYGHCPVPLPLSLSSSLPSDSVPRYLLSTPFIHFTRERGKSFNPFQHVTWRPTCPADQPAHLESARQPGGHVRPVTFHLRILQPPQGGGGDDWRLLYHVGLQRPVSQSWINRSINLVSNIRIFFKAQIKSSEVFVRVKVTYFKQEMQCISKQAKNSVESSSVLHIKATKIHSLAAVGMVAY